MYKSNDKSILSYAAKSYSNITSSLCTTLNDNDDSTGYYTNTTQGSTYVPKYNTSLCNGCWGSRRWSPPAGYTVNGTPLAEVIEFAGEGCAPAMNRADGNSLWGGINCAASTAKYLFLTYYSGKLRYAISSTSTKPSSWTDAPNGNNCNVVICNLIGGGGGGGGGSTSNPVIGYSYAAGGGGGGGGAFASFLYKFNHANSDSSEYLTFVIGSGGSGGNGASQNSSGRDGSAGGQTSCYKGSESANNLLVGAPGGCAGRGGVAKSSGGSGGGTTADIVNNITASHTAFFIQGIKGVAGANGCQRRSDGKPVSNNATNLSGNFTFTSGSTTICTAQAILQGNRGRSNYTEYRSDVNVRCDVRGSGGDGGASVVSHGRGRPGTPSTIDYGSGGPGGTGYTYDSSGEWSSAGDSGYCGIVMIEYGDSQ